MVGEMEGMQASYLQRGERTEKMSVNQAWMIRERREPNREVGVSMKNYNSTIILYHTVPFHTAHA